MSLICPDMLVNVDWLRQNLNHPDLRIVDCHYNIIHKSPEDLSFESGLEAWRQSHIPGSVYIDLMAELSDRDTELPFMMPSLEQFAAVMGDNGIGEGTAVVVYDRAESVWAARLWLMLSYFGFDNAALLDGGWDLWFSKGFPVTCEIKRPRATVFDGKINPGLIASKEDVIKSTRESTIRICALDKESFDQGHIPNSLNIPARDLIDPVLKTFSSNEKIAEIFQKNGVTTNDRVITYCGGGIAASLCFIALNRVGHKNVRVYDGSMEEWRRDPNLPLEKS